MHRPVIVTLASAVLGIGAMAASPVAADAAPLPGQCARDPADRRRGL